jgi:septal ring factor EnvC (AmiA/AmiB activator)
LSNRLTRLLYSLLSATLVIVATMPALAAEDTEAEREAEMARVKQKITQVKAALERDLGKKSSMVKELRSLELEVSGLARAVAELDAEIKGHNRQLSKLGKERKSLQADLASQRDALAGQIRASYALGRQERLKMLLNQEDPAAVGRVLVYYDYFNRARSEQIQQVRVSLQRLDSVERDIKSESLLLNAARERRQADKRELESSRNKRKTLLAKLEHEIKGKDDQLKRLQADQKRLAQLLLSLRDVSDALAAGSSPTQRPFKQLRGKLPWPAAGRIIGDFGKQRASARINWSGVMIRANSGTEVRSISHGRVAFADWLRGFGLMLIVDHGDGYMSLYGHNESLFKEVGDWVEGGEVVATVGDSGGLDRAGLYFELRHDGEPINPRRWCKRANGNRIGMN